MKFFIPAHGETVATAEELPVKYGPRIKSTQPDDFAIDCAEYCHSYCDGWEWDWPVQFAIVKDDGTVELFQVDIIAEPTFTAAPVRQAVPA